MSLVNDPIRDPWRAQPNRVGGWRITLDKGNTVVADFVAGEVAEHIVKLHNDWLTVQSAD